MNDTAPPVDDIGMHNYPYNTCTGRGCRKHFSQSWPKGTDRTRAEMEEHCEARLRSYGWVRTWFGGWLCHDCAMARQEARMAMAKPMFYTGVALGLLAVGLALRELGVW